METKKGKINGNIVIKIIYVKYLRLKYFTVLSHVIYTVILFYIQSYYFK